MRTYCKLYEFRGVWVATVYDIDWPKTKDNPEAQKQEFIELLDKVQSLNLNAVFVQVRPTSDAFYDSKINPWSAFLTGVQGKYPGYDPMKFMIEETHKRNMQFHAWLNPYRITTKGTDLSVLADNNPAKLHPEWVLSHNDALFYNPQNQEVINYVATTVFEIVSNYDVDGIHFDEYFYPYGYPPPEGECGCGCLCTCNCICGCEYVCEDTAENRRAAINNLIKTVYRVIKATKPNVEFGVSPFGVWKNKSSDVTGSNTNALEGYYDLYIDSLSWIQEGIIDYIAPQVYWETTNVDNPYETLVKWWASIVDGTKVKLYIGQNINKKETAREVDREIEINRQYKEVKGNILFSYRDIAENNEGVVEKLQRVYAEKACIRKKNKLVKI
ncbi:glycoside hydrolase family 10 protein [Paraclostridium sordellii]|uniref:glycoside hydrolase family 10 protein n=1 Tax=Paraclostridium sordellii TaxID=1505 RepID=UPI0005DB28A4|nr:family 10 glycosylhydrolase [Paeniclostridium sordellii]CEO08986.1 cell surface protein [[Clostridium] sordellii] [Paeniclostridium sordellii]CEP87404.1 cell surface protein [[Clostridium] sordellii] [Paeniclostridium sordellii]CEP95744.1 cell surface protein [[Clostridium] sordellii] [Paeniclostridium sordellii]CEP98915.1 cell surface protein [[Clostridium] sordellii] [Paeniclostridium sordellii]